MTATTLAPHAQWDTFYSAPGVAPIVKPPKADGETQPEAFWRATGTSASLPMLGELLAEVSWLWQNLPTQRLEMDIEQEVVVLLPPIRQRIVKVKLHHVGRAQPLISLEDAPELFHDL